MTDLLVGLGLMLAIEGVAYALFPDAMRRMVARILAEPSERVRYFGLIMAAIGVATVWFVRS
jgi:uncharacterized protein YjeT (DUF2065 family)